MRNRAAIMTRSLQNRTASPKPVVNHAAKTLARSNGSPELSASVQDRKGTTSGNSRLWRRARQRRRRPAEASATLTTAQLKAAQLARLPRAPWTDPRCGRARNSTPLQRPQAGTRSIYPAKDQLALNSPRPRLRSLAAVSVSSTVASNVLCNHSTSAKATACKGAKRCTLPRREYASSGGAAPSHRLP
jgi:hypothetical protein